MSKRDIEYGGVELTYSEALRRHEELQRQAREEQRSAPAQLFPDEITDPAEALRWLVEHKTINRGPS